MPATFVRTMRSVEADGLRGLLRLLIPLVLLAAWSGWLFLARVSVYAVSDTARLEAESAAHAVQAPVAGRVARVAMTLGADVHAGDLLVELESEKEKSFVVRSQNQP